MEMIRLAKEQDASDILSIYAPYVEHTAFTFEYEVPTLQEFSSRIVNTLKVLPWIVYEIDGSVVGYAYASEHRKRAAYQWSVDLSVYIKQEFHGRRIAKILYECLIDILKLQGYYNTYAGVSIPNPKSEHFHESFGFRPIGIYHKVGYKFDKWHDTKWYELTILDHSLTPNDIQTIKELENTPEYRNIFDLYAVQI